MIGGPIYAIWYADGAHNRTIHYPPPWNHPPPLKYAVGDRVVTSFGSAGTISDILPAASTSSTLAFHPSGAGENPQEPRDQVALILRDVAKHLEHGADYRTLQDSDSNRVGVAEFKSDDPPESAAELLRRALLALHEDDFPILRKDLRRAIARLGEDA